MSRSAVLNNDNTYTINYYIIFVLYFPYLIHSTYKEVFKPQNNNNNNNNHHQQEDEQQEEPLEFLRSTVSAVSSV